MLFLKPEHKLIVRLLALAALLLLVPLSWKGRLLLGCTGVLAIVVWRRNHL